MTREQTIQLAKRELVDAIYTSVCVEGLALTFPDTETILDNAAKVNAKTSEVFFVVNMKRAWEFVLDTLDEPVTIQYLCQLNQICGRELIGDCGELRKYPVKIGGCAYIPPLPREEAVADQLHDIGDDAIELFCYLCKAQLFPDGNKRLAQLAANKILINNGQGILMIPPDKVLEFRNLLVNYYETGSESLAKFLKKECILSGDHS